MRTFPQALIEGYQADAPNLLFLVELDWPSGKVRVHSGIGEIKINQLIWQGVGNLGRLGTFADNTELGRSELGLEISVFDPSLLAEAFRRDAVGREGMIYTAVRDDKGQPIEASFTPMFAGYINDVNTVLGNNNAIKVTLATDTSDPRRKRPGRYTDESHRREYPDDHFYRWATKTVDRPIYWGGKRDAYPYK